ACPTGVSLLKVTDLREVNGRWEGRVGSQWLRVPGGHVTPSSSVYVRLLPEGVSLGGEAAEGPDTAGRLEGVVCDVLPLADGALVGVDVGQVVWARVSPADRQRLGVAPGRPVTCLVLLSALSVIGQNEC